MPTIHIRFKPSIQTLVDKFGDVQIDKFLEQEIKTLAFMIERESKMVTPVKTGRLRASIGITQMQPLVAEVAPNVGYDIFVHEGTRYMRARPFMNWGTTAATDGAEERIGRALGSWLEKKLAI